MKKEKQYKNYCMKAHSHSISMYATGRLTTMERADFQLLHTMKQDTPALNLIPRALLNHHMSGRVTVKIAPITSRPCNVWPTTAGMLPVATYRHSPVDKLLINKRATMPSRSEVKAFIRKCWNPNGTTSSANTPKTTAIPYTSWLAKQNEQSKENKNNISKQKK